MRFPRLIERFLFPQRHATAPEMQGVLLLPPRFGMTVRGFATSRRRQSGRDPSRSGRAIHLDPIDGTLSLKAEKTS
jgi:hypothetical protein